MPTSVNQEQTSSGVYNPTATSRQSEQPYQPQQYRPQGQYNPRGYDKPSGPAVLCSFYTKIGACRHGERCSKKHMRPTTSNTIMLSNLYQNPKLNQQVDGDDTAKLTEEQVQEQFDQFYKDVFVGISKIGKIDALVVCENENDHLNGNVYVQFSWKSDAAEAVSILNQKWYNERPVYCELSPVSDFEEAKCRAYMDGNCDRGERCNYMHVRNPSFYNIAALVASQRKSYLLKELDRLKKEVPSDHVTTVPTGGDDNNSNKKKMTKDETTAFLLQQLS
ncbi:SPAP8A3.06 Splicing factor U2AF 23 kDa subunit [Candida maltosa Xu316]